MTTTVEDPLTVSEAARIAKRDPQTIRLWVWSGKLPARKIAGGRQWFIESKDLEALLKSRRSA